MQAFFPTESVQSVVFIRQKIELFITLFNRDYSQIQVLIDKLREITDSVEEVHRGATIGSISGSVIGAAGGITSIVGLILAPFTLGASLIVTGVGIGVAAAGGVTGAASNITNMIKQKTSREEIEKILMEVQEKLNPMIDCLKEIEIEIEEFSASSSKAAKAGAGIAAGVGGFLAGGIRLARIADIGKVAAQVSRTVRVAGAISGVLSGLFVVLDIFFIAQDAIELDQMNNPKKGKKVKSATAKFLIEMRNTISALQEALDELKEVKGKIQIHTESEMLICHEGMTYYESECTDLSMMITS
uniref:Uncharacterized protein n=1 Tax=Astyanax mexicanus TaxID=7994 RepID=A0A3B1JKG5_ASTMX